MGPQVRECGTYGKSITPHCISSVQLKWTSANHDFQRISEFYFSEVGKSYQYFIDFDPESPVYEGYKCCIIYELLDFIDPQFKKKCVRISFGPMDEVIHLFITEFRNNCFHYTIDNELFDMISGGKSHPFEDRNEYQRCETFPDVKEPKESSLNTSVGRL
jgi:hypothetical protein